MRRGARLSALGARLVLSAVVALLPSVAHAQPPQQQDRARLEGDVRRGFARAVRERVGLSDDQMRRMGPLTQKHERQRRQLQIAERRARVALQSELLSATPDTLIVSRQLDTLLMLQRQRVELIEAEHRELAAVMTPVQRARYLALQEQVRRRVEQMRQGPPGGGGDRPPMRRGRPPA